MNPIADDAFSTRPIKMLTISFSFVSTARHRSTEKFKTSPSVRWSCARRLSATRPFFVGRQPVTRHEAAGGRSERTEQIGQRPVAPGRARPERRLAEPIPVDITVRDARHAPRAGRGRPDTVAKQRERVLQRPGSRPIDLSLLQAAIGPGGVAIGTDWSTYLGGPRTNFGRPRSFPSFPPSFLSFLYGL